VFAKTNAENALSLVPAGQRDQMRVMVLLDDVSHLNEHYGNIVTYMRIKGHVPPSTLREQRGSGH
jgi:spore coat protein CotF